jgi:hypothetical protein
MSNLGTETNAPEDQEDPVGKVFYDAGSCGKTSDFAEGFLCPLFAKGRLILVCVRCRPSGGRR